MIELNFSLFVYLYFTINGTRVRAVRLSRYAEMLEFHLLLLLA